MWQSYTKFTLFGLSLLLFLAHTTNVIADISDRDDVQKFIKQMTKKHHFDAGDLDDLFKHVITKKKIIDAITRPAEAKPWYQYRPIFLTDKRIEGGVNFWEKNAADLKRAYNVYGVPPEIVIAIIGVETLYGKHKGGYRIMDSLSTLAFDYPKRGRFFRSELEQFLLLAKEEQLDPLILKGSYAGAMGKPQFIASSYRSFAVDFDKDGKRDLWENSTDAIGSVANYFKRHQWQRDQPITSQADVSGLKNSAELVKKGIKPHIKVSELVKNGITLQEELPYSEMAALIELETKDGSEHWVALDNFYVITRYNHSQLYAMAVYQLSQAILEKHKLKIVGSKD